jgi:hypothetical protein
MCGFHQNEKRIQNSFENCFGNLEKKMKGFLSLSLPSLSPFGPGGPAALISFPQPRRPNSL